MIGRLDSQAMAVSALNHPHTHQSCQKPQRRHQLPPHRTTNRPTMTHEDLPLWVFRVAALLQDYEGIHEYKNECLQTALITIPREVHEMTRFLGRIVGRIAMIHAQFGKATNASGVNIAPLGKPPRRNHGPTTLRASAKTRNNPPRHTLALLKGGQCKMDIQRHGCTITLDWNEQQILAKLASHLVSKGTSEPYQLDSAEVRILGELVLIGVH